VAQQPTILFGVGAAKAGTSWLWRYLAGHPECHFRSIKELHYFDGLAQNRLAGALRKARAELNRWRDEVVLASDARAAGLARRMRDLQDWIAVLALGANDPAAYRAYLTSGAAGPARVVGDITPAYALLPVARLREMAGLARDVRFVYLMRDPVARLWSHVRMLARRHAPESGFADYALTLLRRVCAGDVDGQAGGVVARGDYAAALARFDRAIDPARLLVMFQETLLSQPGVARLTGFLGIAAHPADLGRQVHGGVPLALPVAERDAARAFLRPQYDAVARRFGDLPEAWRMNAGGGV
jgi:hypothetical protein